MFSMKFPIYGRLCFRYCSSISVLTVKETLLTKPINSKVKVQGWVQAVRLHKGVYFVDLVDGTCLDRLQIIIDADTERIPTYGSSIKAVGSIIESSHKGQDIELIAESWHTIGTCAESYPFVYHQKFSPEFIRQYLHLRPRTRRFSSVLRIRNHASMAVHKYFQDAGFCFVHTPVITQNDCEGAGEVFTIETLKKLEPTEKLVIQTKDQAELKKDGDSKSESSQQSNSNPLQEEKFFGSPAYLTVSGQLHLEALACLSRVYNFGPTFRAENSPSRLHASEFQMIEAEIAFVESVEDLLKTVENCIKKITETILSTCGPEIDFLTKEIKQHDVYLQNILEKPFVRMSYKDAISILEKQKKSLKTPIKFGDDLATAHKQLLVKHCDNIPVFVSMFPSTLKPFYMKEDENKMSHCFDLFAAYGGEICGGSLREDSEMKLREKFSFEENSSLQWYLDLRKFGSVPHGGFGIGFERLLQSILGILNIRDVIPFPRRRFDCKC